MKFEELSKQDEELIRRLYDSQKSGLSRKEAQTRLSDKYDVTPRTIRDWAKRLGIGTISPNQNSKILIYDIETSQGIFKSWWTGKRFIGGDRMVEEPKVISIAWKWLGEDMVQLDHWDMATHDDKGLVERFLVHYNEADLVIGQNNDKFDNRWVNARALKHGLYVNTFVRSLDLMKQNKRLFRLPSYSMKFMSKFLGITEKQEHEGILMWDMIEDGTPEEQREYMDKMLEYNIGDIVTTEEMYLKLRPYIGHTTHLGALQGKGKYSCPHCGNSRLELIRTTSTPSGTLQRIMRCPDDKIEFRISNSLYLKNVNNL